MFGEGFIFTLCYALFINFVGSDIFQDLYCLHDQIIVRVNKTKMSKQKIFIFSPYISLLPFQYITNFKFFSIWKIATTFGVVLKRYQLKQLLQLDNLYGIDILSNFQSHILTMIVELNTNI